jgi:hypothetical protein
MVLSKRLGLWYTNTVVVLLDIICCLFLFKRKRVGEWIMSPSSGGILSLTQAIELVPMSGDADRIY